MRRAWGQLSTTCWIRNPCREVLLFHAAQTPFTWGFSSPHCSGRAKLSLRAFAISGGLAQAWQIKRRRGPVLHHPQDAASTAHAATTEPGSGIRGSPGSSNCHPRTAPQGTLSRPLR